MSLTLEELEAAILAAHKLNHPALEELQARYRSLGGAIRGGPPVSVIEGTTRSTRSSPTRSSPTRSSPTRSSPTRPDTVALSRAAYQQIQAYWRGDPGRETGGPLLGTVCGSVVFIDYAPEAGPRAQRGPRFIRFNSGEIGDLERAYSKPCIGDWHLHPNKRDPEPSRQDRSAWGGLADEFGIPWTGIIIGDDPRSYIWPKRAWVAISNGGRPQTYPATLIEED